MVKKYPNQDTPSIEQLEQLLSNALGSKYTITRRKLPIGPDFVQVKQSGAVGIAVLRYKNRIVSNQFIPDNATRGFFGAFSLLGLLVYQLVHGGKVKAVREDVDRVLREQLPTPK